MVLVDFSRCHAWTSIQNLDVHALQDCTRCRTIQRLEENGNHLLYEEWPDNVSHERVLCS